MSAPAPRPLLLLAAMTAAAGAAAAQPAAAPATQPAPSAAQGAAAALQPGQRIEARWRTVDHWYPAVLVEAGTDGTHLIRYDSNDLPERVAAAAVRPVAGAPALPAYRVGDRVRACTGDYSCLEEVGTVTQVGGGPRVAQWEVRFADGRTKWRNGYVEINGSAAGSAGAAGSGSARTAAGRSGAAPAAARALPAAVPTGRYWCYDGEANWRYMNQVGGGIDNHQMLGYSSHTGVIDVTGPASYRGGTQVKWQKPGAYRYDRATGRITFGAGPYKPAEWGAVFAWSGPTPYFTLTYRSPRHGDLTSTCVRR